MTDRRPPESILRGRRALEGIDGIRLLEPDPTYFPSLNRWIIRVELTIDVGSKAIPPVSEWYIKIHPEYPYGSIDIMPAIEKSVSTTFVHQSINRTIDVVPWRSGRICVDYPGTHLRGPRFVSQPNTEEGRLVWHLVRALDWLRAAANDMLALPGEPYEHPSFQIAQSKPTLVYEDDQARFPWWSSRLKRYGTFECEEIRESLWLARNFADGLAHRNDQWGSVLTHSKSKRVGYWIALDYPPLLDKYATPNTWGDLRAATHAIGTNLDAFLRHIVRNIGGKTDKPVLIGFPIPERFGDEPSEMFWQALLLPSITGNTYKKGFDRSRPQSQWIRNRAGVLSDDKPLRWISTKNVAESHQAVRGTLPSSVREAKVAIIGCGAIGATLADILVRKGVRNLALCDFEDFEVENIRRHVLSLLDVDYKKGLALSVDLSWHSFFVNVDFSSKGFQGPRTISAIDDADIIIDCTAEDLVSYRLSTYADGRKRHFYSFSLSVNADRLYAFHCTGEAFDVARFGLEVSRWTAADRDRLQELASSLRDLGCHNPVFPAPWERIISLAGRAVAFLQETAAEQHSLFAAIEFANCG